MVLPLKKMPMNYRWLSAYIYYEEPFEVLLTKWIKPFVENLQTDKKIEGYFFIRYWERGPHIRLRILGDSEMLDKQIKSRLLATFHEFINEYPSERKKPEWVKTLPADQRWYPNNSIQFIEYVPEVVRYGGEYTFGLAEEHFQYSSDVVLAILASGKDWSYDRALGAALQLHLSFAYAIGLNGLQAQQFFNRVYEGWFSRTYYLVPASTKQEERKRPKKILAAFKKTLDQQKNVLLPFMDSFWQHLKYRSSFEESWLNEWIEKVKKTDEQLRVKQENGQLTTPYPVQIKGNSSLENKSMLERWSIYDSFIHMTNNRLGIQNRDEGYLGYLLKEGLKHETKQQ